MTNVVHLQVDRDATKAAETQAASQLQFDRDADLSTGHRDQAANGQPHREDLATRRRKCISDCNRVLDGTMTRKRLRELYPDEYNSHRNMLQREKQLGREVTPEWHDFVRCLLSVGPRHGPGHTLDRLDNSDPQYAPGKVAWRDKKDQANNRSSTKFVEIDGVRQPVSWWAREANVAPDTIRKRLRENWPDREAVYGRNPLGTVSRVDQFWPGSVWEGRFQKSGTTYCRLAWWKNWLENERRRLWQLVEPYEPEYYFDHEDDFDHPAATTEFPPNSKIKPLLQAVAMPYTGTTVWRPDDEPPEVVKARARLGDLRKCHGMMSDLYAQHAAGVLQHRDYWLGKTKSYLRQQRAADYQSRYERED